MASDVYALGATLLFAATGHPPYQGASVLDVLARLATEDPDLSGLPAGLTGLIAACLQRVPRDRPTSPAILAQLGPFTAAPGGPAEEHAYLPGPVMARIGEYQRSPQLTALISSPAARPGCAWSHRSAVRRPDSSSGPAALLRRRPSRSL